MSRAYPGPTHEKEGYTGKHLAPSFPPLDAQGPSTDSVLRRSSEDNTESLRDAFCAGPLRIQGRQAGALCTFNFHA